MFFKVLQTRATWGQGPQGSSRPASLDPGFFVSLYSIIYVYTKRNVEGSAESAPL